jgi:Beta-ketoacyl synthase, N-terminal domain
MKRLQIHGVGTCARGFEQPFVESSAQLEQVPIKDYAKPKHRRRFGLTTKLMYIAASRAIQHAGIEDPSRLALIGATALGEAASSIKLIGQIHQTKGVTISPALVSGSVHGAPAGHLSIGIGSRAPSTTVSQGWLSAEAGLAAAADFIGAGLATEVLVMAGDESDPNWADQLREAQAPHWAEDLDKAAFQEGGIAFVVGGEPGGKRLGSVVAGVERVAFNARAVRSLLDRNAISPGPDAQIRLRQGAGGNEIKDIVALSLNRDPETIRIEGPGAGTAQSAAFSALAAAIDDKSTNELLLLGTELDEMAFLHWQR